jgi:hypothetical protein
VSTGRAAARVQHSAAGVAALEGERELACGVDVEGHAAALELPRPLEGLLAEHAGCASPRRAASGREGVLQVQLGAVVRGERRRQASLRAVAGGPGQRRAGDEPYRGAGLRSH